MGWVHYDNLNVPIPPSLYCYRYCASKNQAHSTSQIKFRAKCINDERYLFFLFAYLQNQRSKGCPKHRCT